MTTSAVAEVHATFDEVPADLLLTPDEVEVRAAVRAIAQRDIRPAAAGHDADASFASDGYQLLAAAGLAGFGFPVELGGSGGTTVAYAVAMEEIAAACGATSLLYMTQTHAAYPIVLGGSPALHERYVPDLLRGRAYGSMAITEPGAGSDVATLRTVAEREGDEYVINGSKTFITTGSEADVIVLFATTAPSAGRRGISVFVVPGDAPGVSSGQPFHKMGMRGSPTSELFFDSVRIPSEHRLGPEGGGWDILLRSVVKSRVSAAAQGVGLARGALTSALVALGPPGDLGDNARHVLTDARARLLQARILLYTVARAIDADHADPRTAEVAMMKFTCTDLAMDLSLLAMDLLGARGDLVELGVERFARDAKVTQIYDGTNEIQRMLVARDSARRLEGARP